MREYTSYYSVSHHLTWSVVLADTMLASSILPQCMGEKASNHNYACPFAAGMPANSYLPPQYQMLPVTAQMQYNAAMQGYGLR